MSGDGEPSVIDRTRRLLARAQSRASLPVLAVAAVLVAVLLLVGHEVEGHIQALESWVEHLGPWGLIAFVGLFVLLTSLLLPESFLSVAAGTLFGLQWGFLAVLLGSLLGGAVQYGLSRRLLRARIERTLAARPPLAAIQRAVLHDEVRLQALLRLTPLNPAMISYLLGAAGVRFPGFLLSCLALAPTLFLEVYLGHAGKHMARMAGGARTAFLHDLTLLGGLAVGLLVLVVVSRAAHKAVLQAVAEAGA